MKERQASSRLLWRVVAAGEGPHVAVDLEVVELGLAVEIRGLARWRT
jgi:hypothetical protein